MPTRVLFVCLGNICRSPAAEGVFRHLVEDTGLRDSAGQAWVVDSQITANLYGQYEFSEGLAANTRLRVGVRNLTDEKPPVESDNGYLGSLYQPYSRYWYVSVRKSF